MESDISGGTGDHKEYFDGLESPLLPETITHTHAHAVAPELLTQDSLARTREARTIIIASALGAALRFIPPLVTDRGLVADNERGSSHSE